MPAIRTTRLETYYELDGAAGTPLVLVSGLGANLDGWDVELREALARRHRCLVFDNRGTGRSARPPGPYTIEQFADDGVALLDALGFERVHLLGASMGGLIAQEMAMRLPGRLYSLTLACTFPGFTRFIPPSAEALEVLLGRGDMDPMEAERFGWPIFYRPEFIAERRDWLEAKARQTTRYPCPPDVYQWHLQAAGAWDNAAGLQWIDAPTLLMTGEDDRIIPPENSETLHALLPHATLKTYPNGAHCFMTEQIDAVVADLLAHTAAHEPATV